MFVDKKEGCFLNHTRRNKNNFYYIVNECCCSYCYGKNKLHYGINIPKQWYSFNSWYIIKIWKGIYIRFHLIDYRNFIFFLIKIK